MAGHSKWKQIKRKKALTDARRGASWTKVIREITVGGQNFELPLAEDGLAALIKQHLNDIRYGRKQDQFGWNVEVS